MLSVTAAHEIRAPVARVWNVLVDAGRYGFWHPFLGGTPNPHRDLWSDDTLTVSLRPAEDAAAEVPTNARVVEVRRFQLVSMLLQQQTAERTASPRHSDVPPKTVGSYQVILEVGQAGRTVLRQHISLRHSHGMNREALDAVLRQIATRIAGRVEWTRDHERLRRPITGAVCVSSRSGLRQHESPSRSRFLTTIAEWMGRRQGGASE